MPSPRPQEWYKDQFLISTSQALLQVDAICDVFAQDWIYWSRAISPDTMKKMLSNSLCFGIYALPASTSELAGQRQPLQIGLGRLITDECTFAYLTDVYILPVYRGKGLATWLVTCVDEVLKAWPDLRRTMLYTSDGHAAKLYERLLGMETICVTVGGAWVMQAVGPGFPVKKS